MDNFPLTILLMSSIALLFLPRRLAPLPLLIGACYLTLIPRIEVGPLHFFVLRMLIVVGSVRVLIRSERLEGQINSLDRLMLIWSVWMLVSSFFHNNPSAALIYRLGLVYDACGTYFLLRIFCQSLNDVKNLCFIIAILLLPIAVEMIYEKLSLNNLFSVLSGGSEIPEIREGKIRARGAFANAILAGTVGAVCLPFVVGLWQQHRIAAFAGIIACVTMVVTCASSGPILSTIVAIGALFMWRYRNLKNMRFIRWFAVMLYIALDIVMKDPAYFLIARIDLVGGSTGWHRARLIQSSIEHLPEWWLAGTDFTRHWMATGLYWSGDVTDITNHYIQMGVVGGLPLMLLFIAIVYKGFSFVGRGLRQADNLTLESQFMFWVLGASLFTDAVTFLSVSYFDQSSLFIYLTLAAIGSAYSSVFTASQGEEFPV